MPITSSATKAMHQNRKKYMRNKHYKSQMKSMIKLVLDSIIKGEKDKAEQALRNAIKSIDTAYKKNLIHFNNARRKKSRIQKAVNKFLTSK